MRPEAPAWWYGAETDLRARALAPLGQLYGWLAEQRYRRAVPYRSALPVICVGNFTAGGTGKTPLALRIGEHLIARGRRPVFLTRGYGGRRRGPHWVDAEADRAEDVGDEPLLLARLAPTLVCRDRRAGAMAIETSEARPDVVVMDDGLQNPSLAKDLVIAVIDGVRGLGNHLVLPAGPLRAPLDFQIDLAHALLVNGGSAPEAADGRDVLSLLRRTFPGPVLWAEAHPAGDVAWLAAEPILAYAGIGNPERFFSMLERHGARIAHRYAFPDHHRFSEEDAARLLQAADATGARPVTTEKDVTRLEGAAGRRGELKARSRAVPIRLRLDTRDEGRLAALIDSVLQENRQDQSLPLRRSST